MNLFTILCSTVLVFATVVYSWGDDSPIEHFYRNCTKPDDKSGTRTKCVGYPVGCIETKTCLFMGSVTENATMLASVLFEKCDNTVQSFQSPDNWTIQGLEASGIATLDKSRTKFECREPGIEDFKFFFLFNDTSICNATDVTDESYSMSYTYKDRETWNDSCKNYDIPPSPNADYKFNLKYFLNNYLNVWSTTKYFNSPFEFADTYNYNVAYDNMLYYGRS